MTQKMLSVLDSKTKSECNATSSLNKANLNYLDSMSYNTNLKEKMPVEENTDILNQQAQPHHLHGPKSQRKG